MCLCFAQLLKEQLGKNAVAWHWRGPHLLNTVVLAVADGLFALCGSEHRSELFIGIRHPRPPSLIRPLLYTYNLGTLSNRPLLYTYNLGTLRNRPLLYTYTLWTLGNKPLLYAYTLWTLRNKPLLYTYTLCTLRNKPLLYTYTLWPLRNKPLLYTYNLSHAAVEPCYLPFICLSKYRSLSIHLF